jgi:hypothetical protein
MAFTLIVYTVADVGVNTTTTVFDSLDDANSEGDKQANLYASQNLAHCIQVYDNSNNLIRNQSYALII